ncbi:MAG: ribosome small subunit-dependent GTPase A [Pseudomonadota bacterium]
MSRDYSKFLPSAGPAAVPKRTRSTIETLGWQPWFAQQVSADEMADTPPVRVTEIHRNGLHLVGDEMDRLIPPGPEATVGDWLMLNAHRPGESRVLQRKSLFKRRAPGTDRKVQLIAANIDTAFIVSSCNQDFNVARLERYVAVALEAEVEPVILLTKTDLVDAPDEFVEQAAAISELTPVLALDARGGEPAEKLGHWCRTGRTLAFLGSSGVGKSTLVNALTGTDETKTQGIREDDAKGRHTTTRRQLHVLPGGGVVLDTPGMRELQLTDAASGIGDLFSDIQDLAGQCRFRDCQHETEPGCAVLQALEEDRIDAARLSRWRKLVAEDRYNSASLAERRARDKAFGKMVRRIQDKKRR